MPIICHLKTADEDKPFKWDGEGVVRHRRRPTELYFPSFIYGDMKVEKGDFVLVRNDESIDPEDSMNCFVARVDDLYESDDIEVPHKAKVQWYSRIFELPPQFTRNLPNVDYSRELVEDHRSEFSNIIDAESIFSVKCVVITIQENFKTKPPVNSHMSVFYCRYKFDGGSIVPKILKYNGHEIEFAQIKEDTPATSTKPKVRKSRNRSKSGMKAGKEKSSATKNLKDQDFEKSVFDRNSVRPCSVLIEKIDFPIDCETIDCHKMNLRKKGSYNFFSDYSEEFSKSPRNALSHSLKRDVSFEEAHVKSLKGRKSHRLKSILKDGTPKKIPKIETTEKAESSEPFTPKSRSPAPKASSTRRSSRKASHKKTEVGKCATTPSRRSKLRNVVKDDPAPLSERKPTRRSLNFTVKQEDQTIDEKNIVTTRYGRKVKSVNNLLNSDLDSLLYTPKKTSPKKDRTVPRKNVKFYHSDVSDGESAYAPSEGESSDENDVFPDSKDFISEKRKTPARRSTPRTPQSRKKTHTPVTPTIPGRQQPVNTPQSLLEESRQRLHVSAVPASLPCREEEFSDIYSFIRSNLLNRTGGCMYVSGVPGTGKTATVHEVIKNLEKERDRNRLPSFQFVEVNGMKMTDPYQCYVQIYQKLTGDRIAPQQAANLLEKRFTQAGLKKEAVVLLVDELDKLWTRKQTVMYNIFDWPSKPCSRLIVIAIANTMDLPERIMMNRISSRLGLTRKTFQPYTFRELQEIVMSRIKELRVFNPDAVQLVARKVAAISGDARRALEICRRAAEVAEEGSIRTSPSKKQRMLVEMAHVDAALNQMFGSPVVIAVRGLSELQKMFLNSVLAEFQRTGNEETDLLKSYQQLVARCRFEGLRPPTTSDVSGLCVYLASSNIVLIDNVQNDLYMKIRLNVSIDDVNYALTGCMS